MKKNKITGFDLACFVFHLPFIIIGFIGYFILLGLNIGFDMGEMAFTGKSKLEMIKKVSERDE